MHAKFQGIWGGIGGDMDQFKISSANLHPYNPNPNRTTEGLHRTTLCNISLLQDLTIQYGLQLPTILLPVLQYYSNLQSKMENFK